MPATTIPQRDEAGATLIRLGRRNLLRALAAGAAFPRAAFARASGETGFEDGATLMVAGSERGRLDEWASVLAPALERGLPPGAALRRQLAGGDDGVSGANQFEARAAPDGRTALLLPGEAALAWLAGDPRARFDATRFVPILAGWTPGAVFSRVPLGALPAGSRLRIAAADPAGADLAALLGLELLRIEAAPQFRVDGFEAGQAALAARSVDALFVHGSDAKRHAAALGDAGLAPLFSLGAPDAAGGAVRDRLFADVPTLPELLASEPGAVASGPLCVAWRAAAAAAQIDFALVLPALTPAAMVALWRRAASGLPAAPELQPAFAAGMRTGAAAGAVSAALAPDAVTVLELRRWLADRWNWQPA
jgi:hypothetical protein